MLKPMNITRCLIIMKYYSEEDTRDLRLALEKEILSWAEVTEKKMFGCPCYQVKGRLFAFLVTKGIVITQLSADDKEKLSSQHQTSFFQAGRKTVSKWIKIPLKGKRDLEELMSFVRKSYDEAFLKE